MFQTLGITKAFGDLLVLDGVSLAFEPDRNYALLGPSGCGKSTFLNILAGLDDHYTGEVLRHDSTSLGYMFQEPTLLPWRTVRENVLISAELGGVEQANIEPIYLQLLGPFGLSEFEDHYPHELSGGLRQRVSLLRSLVYEPRCLLLDEPFASLDFDVKLVVQRQLVERMAESDSTFMMVTHDIEDAIALSDEVVIFSSRPGKVQHRISFADKFSTRDPIEVRKDPKFHASFKKIMELFKW